MPLYDATIALSPDTPVFPGDPPFSMSPLTQVSKGDPCNLRVITMCSHTGTHVDPPSHYFDNSSAAHEIPLDLMVGPGLVADVRGRDRIDRAALVGLDLARWERILFKTDNRAKLLDSAFHEDFVSLTVDAAQYLVDMKVKLVGVDYLSVESHLDEDAPVHKALLSAGILIVEGLLLEHVPAGPCRIYCLPLKITGSDGAPARALVETDE